MANLEDECVLYWNQRQYTHSVRWYPKTNTDRFRLAEGAYQYRIFTSAIDAELNHQESYQNVYYQSTRIIPIDNQDVEVPIAPSNKREKSNTENLTDLVDMTT